MVCEVFGIEKSTYFKYARAGRIYIAEPSKRSLGMETILAKPKALKAPKAPPPAESGAPDSKPAVDEARLAELLKWEAFAMYLSEQMPERHFDAVYNKFLKQYELH